MALTGYGSPKRAINLMGRLGLTVSYQTIVRTLKSTSARKKISSRNPRSSQRHNASDFRPKLSPTS